MKSNLLRYSYHVPLKDAWTYYYHTKKLKEGALKFSFLPHPVFFRGINSDYVMFKQVFVFKEYDIFFPFTPSSIIDLGANVGYASLFFATKFPSAKIFAIEPEHQNFLIAQKNVGPYSNIHLVEGAVWDKSASLNLIDKGFGEASYMIEEDAAGNGVVAYTIPQIMQQMNISEIDVLKMDVEGTEKALFEHGYEEWLPKTKIVIVETHDRYKNGCSKALFQAFSRYNFSLDLSGENLVLYNNDLIKAY